MINVLQPNSGSGSPIVANTTRLFANAVNATGKCSDYNLIFAFLWLIAPERLEGIVKHLTDVASLQAFILGALSDRQFSSHLIPAP